MHVTNRYIPRGYRKGYIPGYNTEYESMYKDVLKNGDPEIVEKVLCFLDIARREYGRERPQIMISNAQAGKLGVFSENWEQVTPLN